MLNVVQAIEFRVELFELPALAESACFCVVADLDLLSFVLIYSLPDILASALLSYFDFCKVDLVAQLQSLYFLTWVMKL